MPSLYIYAAIALAITLTSHVNVDASATCASAVSPQCPDGCARDVAVPCPTGARDCCKVMATAPARTCYQYHDSGYLDGGSFIVPVGGSYPNCPTGFTSTGTCTKCSKYSCPFCSWDGCCYCNTMGYRRTCSRALACPRYTTGECTICADRFYKDAETGQCAKCPAGHRCTGGSKAACAPGTFSAAGAAVCTPCAGNTYAADGATTCLPCPPTSTCAGGVNTACEAGTYTDADHADCTPCPPGHRCAGGEKTACASGSYQDEAARASCKPCAAAAEDTFREGCGGASPGVVKSCTASCAAGSFLTGRCAAGATADASACESCTARAASRCLAGQFLAGCGGGPRNEDGGSCTACAHALDDAARQCPSGRHLADTCAGNGLADTSRCAPCAVCGAGRFTQGCAGASAGACAKCVECDWATQVRIGCGGGGGGDAGQCRTVCARLGRGNATHPQDEPYFEAAKATPDRDRECRPCSDFADASALMAANGTEPTDASRAWDRVCHRDPPPRTPPTVVTGGAFERYCRAIGFKRAGPGLEAPAPCIGATAGAAALVAAGGAALLLVWARRRKRRAVGALARLHHQEMSEIEDQLECANNMQVNRNPLWNCRKDDPASTPSDDDNGDTRTSGRGPEANTAAIAALELQEMAAARRQDAATLKGMQVELRRLKREKELGTWKAPELARPGKKKAERKGREFQALSVVDEEKASDRGDGGWSKLKDPTSGRMYFFNSKTCETSWTMPGGDDSGSGGGRHVFLVKPYVLKGTSGGNRTSSAAGMDV